MRVAATVMLVLGLAGAVASAVPREGQRVRPALTLSSPQGSVRIGNSLAGRAIFTATGLAPGEGATGRVRIVNRSSAGRRLVLRQRVRSSLAVPGGSLLDAVLLTIREGKGARARTVYRGRIGSMRRLRLRPLKSGKRRRYSFAVELPAGAGNAHQGGALALDYVWKSKPLRRPAGGRRR